MTASSLTGESEIGAPAAAGAPASRAQSASLRRGTVANLLGRGWSAVMAVAFVPVYVQLLGVEAYGLVGFAATLQVVFALLDLGLATTLGRELARIAAQAAPARQARDLVRTLETLYWIAAVLIALLVAALAPTITARWLRLEALPPETVAYAIRLMGVSIALQFPFTLYEAGLLGLHRQIALNALLIAGTTLRFAAVVGVLHWVSPTVETFFLWQALVAGLQTLATRAVLRGGAPFRGGAGRFDRALLVRHGRFAAGMAGISVTAVVLTQMDKVVLSRLLTLGAFGSYMLASVVAGALYVLFLPVFQAVFPRLAALVASGDAPAVVALYHRSTQAVAALVLPAAVVMALFAREIMQVWTGSPAIAAATGTALALLAAGTALNGLMNVPYALQLAHGWTSFALYQNGIAIAVLLPALRIAASRFGAAGAAAVWLALNAGYVTVGLTAMHRRLLRGEQRRWYADVGAPLLAALAVAGAARLLVPRVPRAVAVEIALLAMILLAALLAAAAAVPVGRDLLRRLVGGTRTP